MAEEKKILVDIEINSEDIKKANDAMAQSAAASAKYTEALNELKLQQKENNALLKVGAIDSKEAAKRQAELKLKTAEVSKSLRESNKEYANNKTVVDAAKGSNEQLRARLALQTKEYNGLSKAQRENTKEGRQMEANIKTLTDKLKANEKAVGDNRRNVGNYEDALKSLPAPIQGVIGGLKGMVTAAKAFVATPFGAVIAGISLVLSPLIVFLTKTKEGSELLTRAFAGVDATVSVLIDRIATLGGAMVKFFNRDFEGAAEDAKGAFSGITEEIVNETEAAVELEKRMQSLTDAERALTVERSKSRADIKELNKLAEDTSKSLKEREDAAVQAIAIETALMDKQVALAQERFDVIKAQNKQGNSLAADLDKQAEAEKRLADIRMESFEMQTTLQNKLNTIRTQDQAIRQKAADTAKKLSEDEIKAEEERIAAIEQGFVDERQLIDDLAELKTNQAIVNIANAEERAEAIAFIEREALLEKLRSIEDETAAYTASADMIGSVDEEKYAKQLAQRAAFEAELAEMDRAAKAKAFTDEVEYISKQEQLEIQNAEFSIDNAEELEKKKAEISIKFLELKLKLMNESALMDDVLTKQEIQNLQLVENQIRKLKGLLDGTGEDGGVPTFAQAVGMSEEDFASLQAGLQIASQAVAAFQSIVSQSSENRMQSIDEIAQAEIKSIEQSTQSEENKSAKIKEIEKKAAQEKYKIELQQFKTSQTLQITNAIIQGAQAAIAAYSSAAAIPIAGVALAPIMAGVAAAFAAVQIGVIASKKPPAPPQFAKGGILQGASHAEGGIQLHGNGQHYGEAEGGEIILTKGVNANPRLRAEASRLNVLGGGVALAPSNYMADGGIVSPTFAARQTAQTSGLTRSDLTAALADMPSPIVSVTDINRVQGQVASVSQSADL
jgi:uncharacterized coiled-coil protein SlyX